MRDINQARKQFIDGLHHEYGETSAKFFFSKTVKSNKEYEARVFEDSNIIIVIDRDKIVDKIPFCSILDFSVEDEVITIGENTATTVTKTSTGSMIKRGLVGGVLFGGIGALAGAATAKSISETQFNNPDERHEYSITVNIDSLSSPIYLMHFGKDSDKCSKTAGILTVILQRNQNKNELVSSSDKLSISDNTNVDNLNRDSLFDEVARHVVMNGTTSTSAISRRYDLGYNRAVRIMDQLEAAGIVGPAIGGKPRDVLIDAMTLEDILNA